MNIKKIAGAALILLAIANVLYAFFETSSGGNRPGYLFALVNLLLLTFGVLLLRSHSKREA